MIEVYLLTRLQMMYVPTYNKSNKSYVLLFEIILTGILISATMFLNIKWFNDSLILSKTFAFIFISFILGLISLFVHLRDLKSYISINYITLLLFTLISYISIKILAIPDEIYIINIPILIAFM